MALNYRHLQFYFFIFLHQLIKCMEANLNDLIQLHATDGYIHSSRKTFLNKIRFSGQFSECNI